MPYKADPLSPFQSSKNLGRGRRGMSLYYVGNKVFAWLHIVSVQTSQFSVGQMGGNDQYSPAYKRKMQAI